MNLLRTDTKKHDHLFLILVILLSALTALYAIRNIKISPDAMRFGLISEQILSGNGIRVPIMRLQDDYVPVNGAIPFLDQLPLIPILFAALGGVTPDNYLPARLLNLISHIAIAVFTFMLIKRLHGNRYTALLAGVLVSISLPIMRATQQISSEPLFIALTSGAIYFIVQARDRHFNRNFLIACILASVAVGARNAGIGMLPVLFCELIELIRRRQRPQYLPALVAFCIPVLTVSAIFVRNYIQSGYWRGFKQSPPGRSILEAAAGTADMLFKQFALGENGILIVKVSLVSILCLFLVSPALRNRLLLYTRKGLDSILVFLVSYTALICLTMAKQQYRFELRFVYPAVPLLLIAAVVIIISFWNSIEFRKFPGLSRIGLALTLALLLLVAAHKTYSNSVQFSYKQEKAYALLESCTFKWLKANVAEGTIIGTNRPFHLSFFGGYSTIALPHKRFNPTIDVPEDMESLLPERMSRVGARVLALFDETEDRYEGKYIAGLFHNRRSNHAFTLAHDCEDGVVYRLKQ